MLTPWGHVSQSTLTHLNWDIRLVLTDNTAIMTIARHSSGKSSEITECLFMRQHKQISHSLHRWAGNGRCLTVAGWAGNRGASAGESLPSTFRTFIFCSSFPDGRNKVTVNPRAHAFIKRISHFRSRTEVTLKWTSKLEKKIRLQVLPSSINRLAARFSSSMACLLRPTDDKDRSTTVQPNDTTYIRLIYNSCGKQQVF